MKLLSETLTELGVAFSFPIQIKDSNGNETYYENSDGYWCRRKYNAKGNETYCETSDGYWRTKYAGTFGGTGNTAKYEYDAKGNDTYCETCEGKVIEMDGIQYELKAL